MLGFLHLGLLGFQLQLRFLQVDLVGLNLQGVFQLVRRIGPIPILFQLGDLGSVIFNGGGQLFQLQLLLLQSQLELVGVVGEELLALGDIVTLPDVEGVHHLVLILLNFCHAFGNNHSAEPIRRRDPSHLGQGGNLLYKHMVFLHRAGR